MTASVKRTCPECSAVFLTATNRKQFCTPACQKVANNRAICEGMAILELAKAWRLGRNTGKPEPKALAARAFAELCRRVDASNSADHAAGRMPALKLLGRRVAQNAIDLP